MAAILEENRRLYNDERLNNPNTTLSSRQHVRIHEQQLNVNRPAFKATFDRVAKEELNVQKHAAIALLLTSQVSGFPVPAAHERPWQLWYNLATLGLTSTYYRNWVPPTLKAQARGNLLALALGQSDVGVVRRIITTINDRNDPYFDCIATTLHDHFKELQRESQIGRSETPQKRRRLNASPEPRGDTHGRARHLAVSSQAARRLGPRTLSAQRSAVQRISIMPEEGQYDRLSTLSPPSDSASLAETPRVSTGGAKNLSQTSLSPLWNMNPNKEHVKPSSQHQNQSATFANSVEHNNPATPTSISDEEEDALAEGEYFIQKIKSHRYLDLVKWYRRPEQQADWIPRGSILRKGKLHAEKILDSKLELEVQYEGYPEDETTWEAERMLRCPNLEGPNLLEQYKEKYKLGVYADSD